MIGRLNHVAIAVPDLDAGIALYRDTLGAKVGAPQDEPGSWCYSCFYRTTQYQDRAALPFW